jgi:hypothetical protein
MPKSATPNKSKKARNVLIINTKKSLKRSFLSRSIKIFLISENLNEEELMEAIVALYPIISADIKLG